MVQKVYRLSQNFVCEQCVAIGMVAIFVGSQEFELNFLITRHVMDYRSLEEFVVVEELVNLAMAPDDY